MMTNGAAASPDHGSLPLVAVVVLNWNGCDDTRECLSALRRTRYPRLSVLVVDNGSTDDSMAVIPPEHPEVQFIQTGRNLGWAGGNNVGIRIALSQGADHVLLLNNDVVMEPEAIGAMVEAARDLGRALVHPSIYYYDRPDIAQLDATTLGVEPRAGDEAALHAMDHAYGACLLVPAPLFQTIGLLDERFFLQMEETDFYYRGRASGVQAWCAARARVLHKESRSFSGVRSPIKTYYIARNYLLLLSKHRRRAARPGHSLKRYYWTWASIAAGELGTVESTRVGVLAVVRWLTSASPMARATRSGIADFARGRFGGLDESSARRLEPPKGAEGRDRRRGMRLDG